MNAKGIIFLIIFLIFVLPFLIKLSILIIKSSNNPSPENIESVSEELVKSAIPWYIGPLKWFSSLPDIIASILVLLLIILLIWLGAFK